MATLDGYSPYPVNLTAEKTVAAIRRAFNLDEEFEGYIKRTVEDTPPSNPLFGDFYTDGDKKYEAHVEGSNVLWIEY